MSGARTGEAAGQAATETGLMPLDASGGIRGPADEPATVEGATAADIGVDPGSARRRLNGSTLLVVAVLALSAGAIYGMRYLGLGPQAGIAKAMGELPMHEPPMTKGNNKAILDDLNTSRTRGQVPSEQVKKNPFRLVGSAVPVVESSMGGGPNVGDEARRQLEAKLKAQQEWEAAVSAAANSLQLNSVMLSNPPIARINGDLKRVGDRVGKYFTVTSIFARKVQLEVDGGRTLFIEMPETGR